MTNSTSRPVSSVKPIDPMEGDGFEIIFGNERVIQIYVAEDDTPQGVAKELERAIEEIEFYYLDEE